MVAMVEQGYIKTVLGAPVGDRKGVAEMLRSLNNYWVVLLLVGVLTGCTRPDSGEQIAETQNYSGVHIFEGVVSDSSCGATHKTDNAKQCTEACVSGGAGYVLVVGNVVHELKGNTEQFQQWAGERVEVSASLDGNTLEVSRIEPLS
ncbi:MAG: hypothetical protein A3H27_07445 [Acidobacteria bacterium RIFCSPLOWO2_02_FULL_59_13]|nr:MAG: hypothetical protein A3H27_07445 [Acidobacteria bacterium RIFCSPLOWO2_02_FULL_59_13]